MKKNKIVHFSIIAIFVSLYLLVATISMINSVDFFDLSHSGILSWSLAIGFELGAAASLAGIIILDKTNKTMVWGLFILLTLFQMMANSYHAFSNLAEFQGWIELFGLQEEEEIVQKRILAIVSGAVLPIVALGFIKSLTDYIRPSHDLDNDEETKKELISDEEDAERLYRALKLVSEKNKNRKEAEPDSNEVKDTEDDELDYPEPNEALKEAAENYKKITEEDTVKAKLEVEEETQNTTENVEEGQIQTSRETTGDYVNRPKRGSSKNLPWS